MSKKDTTSKTILVAALLCIICSILVSGSAVFLQEKQLENKKWDIKKNLLLASGLIESSDAPNEEIERAYEKVEPWIVDLETGDKVEGQDVESFDMKKAAKNPKENYSIPTSLDMARIKVRSKWAKVYFINNDQGKTEMLVLPIFGKGLWSTLYGFLALSKDTTSIRGIGFYDHGETPGLGGEIDNPRWKALWKGKKTFNESFMPVIKVVKGPGKGDSEMVFLEQLLQVEE